MLSAVFVLDGTIKYTNLLKYLHCRIGNSEELWAAYALNIGNTGLARLMYLLRFYFVNANDIGNEAVDTFFVRRSILWTYL